MVQVEGSGQGGVVEGFSASSPYGICQVYAAGGISREQLIDELARWDYPPLLEPENYFDEALSVPGSWDEVCYAKFDGLIDRGIYGDVLARIDGVR